METEIKLIDINLKRIQEEVNKLIWKTYKVFFKNKKNDNENILDFVTYKSERVVMDNYDVNTFISIVAKMKNWKDLITNAINYCMTKSRRIKDIRNARMDKYKK